MRYCQLALFAAALLTAASGLYGQSTEIIKESDVEVKLEFVESPKIGADNVAPIPSVGLGSAQKWVEISITYVMPSKMDPKTKQVLWIDDFTIVARVMMQAEYNGRPATALLSGKQVLMSVPCDGKKHRASLFIPPVILSRYAASDFKASKSTAKELSSVVIFQTKQQVSLGGGLQVPKGSNRANALGAFKDADSSINGILKLEDAIIPREQTPWAFLDFDAFDMAKPISGGK